MKFPTQSPNVCQSASVPRGTSNWFEIKTEERFPILLRATYTLGKPAFQELKELMHFWDDHQWRPIETAPMHQQVIISDGTFVDTGFRDSPHQKIWLGHRRKTGIEPTHWMPLPKGPQHPE